MQLLPLVEYILRTIPALDISIDVIKISMCTRAFTANESEYKTQKDNVCGCVVFKRSIFKF